MSAMLGRRAYSIGGQFRFLRSSNRISTRTLCSTNVENRSNVTSNNFNRKTQEIFLGKNKQTTRNSMASISSLLREHQDSVDAANIAFLYHTAASIGQVLDSKNVREILSIVRSNKVKMSFTPDDIKEILYGHRYTSDKDKIVRVLLSEILPNNTIKMQCQREIGLSIFGLQNMTAFYPEIRKVLTTLTNHMARCEEPLDGACISGALRGTRSMNATEVEVVRFIKMMTRKISESPFSLSPSGMSQCLNSLQCKTDKKPEILQLLAALNTRLEGVCQNMSASEVCRSLNGLQVMSSQSPILIDTFRLLTNRFMAKDVQANLTGHDLSLALGSLKSIGCSIQETNFLMMKITENIEKLTEPILPKHLVVAFSGLKTMRSTQAGVPKLLSSLTSNMLLLLQHNTNTIIPSFLLPNVLRHMQNMNSDELAVRNFLSIFADVLGMQQQDSIHMNSMDYATCISGMKSMKATEPTVCRVLFYLTNCYLQQSQHASTLDWSQIFMILKGMSSMDNKTPEVGDILRLLAKNIERINSEGGGDNIQYLTNIASAMYSIRNMNVSSAGNKSMKDVGFIYSSLFEKLKERSAVAINNQGLGKNAVISSLASLTAISSLDNCFAEEVMLFIIDVLKKSKNTAMASPYSFEVTICLSGISSRPEPCATADKLLRTFLEVLSLNTLRMCETDIENTMKKMQYSKEEITHMLKSVRHREVIGEAEMNAHFKKAVSLPESLVSLQSSIEDCENGDAVDIYWSSNLLAQIKTHDVSKYNVNNVASLLQSSCEFSQLFFNKHKRQVLPLRQNFINVSLSVLQETTPIFTNNFDDFYTVFCGTHCLWWKGGNKHGDPLLGKTIDLFQHSTLKCTISDVAKIIKLLKKTNSNHAHAERLLSVLNEKLGDSISDTTLDVLEFLGAVRGLRYLVNNSDIARQLMGRFIECADQSELVLSIDELKLAMSSLKNTHNDDANIHSALKFFHSRLSNYDKKDIKVPDLVYLLTCLRFMESSSESLCPVIEEIQRRLPTDTSIVSVNQEMLYSLTQFFNHKRCEDSPAIFKLRDFLVGILDIAGKENRDDKFTVKVVEQMIALKAKRSGDVNMNVVYGSIAIDIVDPNHPRNHITPNMFCVGLLGLDSLHASEGQEGVTLFCEKLDECTMAFSFQAVMLALSALETNSFVHPNVAVMDRVLVSLAQKASNHSSSKVRFPSLLSALRSLAVLANTSSSCYELYPVISDSLSVLPLSHHRLMKVLETLEDVDATPTEIQSLLELLLARMKEISPENYEKKCALPIISSLEKMEMLNKHNAAVQDLKDEVVHQYSQFISSSTDDIVSIENLKIYLSGKRESTGSE